MGGNAYQQFIHNAHLKKVTCVLSYSGKQCRNLTAPVNGNSDKLVGYYEDVATLSCDACHGFGSDGMGPATVQLVCNSTGLWNGSEPTCQSMY